MNVDDMKLCSTACGLRTSVAVSLRRSFPASWKDRVKTSSKQYRGCFLIYGYLWLFSFWPMLVEATAEYWFASLVQWCFHNAHQIISSSLLYLLARLLRQLTNLYHHWTFSRFLSNLREHGSTLFTGEDVDARHSTSPTGMYCGADGLPRTTNSFEGWRREFEQKMNTSHASRDCANSSRPGSWRLGLCRREWSSGGPSASIG